MRKTFDRALRNHAWIDYLNRLKIVCTIGRAPRKPAAKVPEETTIDMKFGYFDDQNREYVITQPDTPLPWINYLGCQAYFGIISNTAGRLLVLSRRPPSPPDPLSLQQRALRFRRALYLSARRRIGPVLVAFVAAHPPRIGELLLPPRHGLHRNRLGMRMASRRTPATSCPSTRISKSGSSR